MGEAIDLSGDACAVDMLARALDERQFVLRYQPKVRLATRRITGVQALLYLRQEDDALLPAAEFIHTLDQSGLIVPVGEWALQEICAQLARWRARDIDCVTISCGVSPRQLLQANFAERLRARAGEVGVPGTSIELEIAENCLMRRADDAASTLARLKAYGFRLAISDFGNGSASPAMLRRLRIDAIKVDPVLVRDIERDPDNIAIVRASVALARELKLTVGADNVVSDAQAALLARCRCDEAQGPLFAPGLTPEDCTALLLPDNTPGVLGMSEGGATETERTLLLLDDEPNVLAALRRALRHDGYRVLVADNAARAFELLAQHRVGVVVSDQRMPQMSGVEFLSRVKELHPDTMRLVLSGYTDLQSVTDAINRGAIFKFITKPWDDDQLREQIREAFVYRELAGENARLALELQAANDHLADANKALSAAYVEKAREAEVSLRSLQFAQQLLEHVPLPVIGVGADGLIAFANISAERMLADGVPLVGAWAIDRLPGAVVALTTAMPGAGADVSIGEACYRAEAHALANPGTERGRLVIFVPIAPRY